MDVVTVIILMTTVRKQPRCISLFFIPSSAHFPVARRYNKRYRLILLASQRSVFVDINSVYLWLSMLQRCICMDIRFFGRHFHCIVAVCLHRFPYFCCVFVCEYDVNNSLNYGIYRNTFFVIVSGI